MAGAHQSVFLSWDSHPAHKPGKVAEMVRSYKGGNLGVFLLPGYSLELNPSESVWREIKGHQLSQTCVFTLSDMKSKPLGALYHLA